MKNKIYYKHLDVVRLISCIAVLLYHLGILKGGYLAVCTFFVLSGYLSCISLFRKEKVSLFSYYKSRFLHIYVPLFIVVFITIFIISFIPSINWINLKPETTSVMLGYNNFWQIGANLDYFARHVNSPFMHFWYIAILLQFDLVFPIIFLLFKKISNKKKVVGVILLILLSIIGTIYFYYMSVHNNIMVVYYNTLARLFSLLFGVSLGFIHHYYNNIVPLKNKIWTYIAFYFYLIIMSLLCILIKDNSKYFALSMIITTLITCRLVDYGTMISTEKISFPVKVVKMLASFSYEIYLVQYPLIFLFQYIPMKGCYKIPAIILLTIIIGYIINYSLSFYKKQKNKSIKIFKTICFIPIIVISIWGLYKYIIAEDHSAEMKALEKQLGNNQKVMLEKQKKYEEAARKKQNEWDNILNDLENGEKNLAEMVANLSIVGVGDSVMLGALNSLYQQFPNGYFDAKVSRTDYEANGILLNLKNRGMLGDVIIFNLGTNGQCGEKCRVSILNTCGDRQIFWINVTNDRDVHVNNDLANFASRHDNVSIIDWNSISKGHYEYFVADGIHLTPTGEKAYSKAIYDSIYKVYLDQYNEKKNKVLNEYKEEQMKKISFYGNSLLQNTYKDIQNFFPDANFIAQSEFKYSDITKKITEDINNKTLTHKIVFFFDKSANISDNEYDRLISLCKDHEIYIIKTNQNRINVKYENVKIIDFYDEIKKHSNYLMADKIHFTNDGSAALSKMINEIINN